MYTSLNWTSLLCLFFYFLILLIAFFSTDTNLSLIIESMIVLTTLSVNVFFVYVECRLRHEELPKRVEITLGEIRRAISNERWQKENYPHMCSPYSPCITLQWTYRDGHLVNLPWALLVKDDIIVVRPGQVSPGYCEAIDKDKNDEYPLLHPKEVYGPSLKSANETITVPKARKPLPNRKYRLLETPFLTNLKTALEQSLERPPTRLDRRKLLVITRCFEQIAVPVCFLLALFVGLIRRMYLAKIFGAGTAVDVYLLTPFSIVLPLLPMVFPLAWILLNNIGNARFVSCPEYLGILWFRA